MGVSLDHINYLRRMGREVTGWQRILFGGGCASGRALDSTRKASAKAPPHFANTNSYIPVYAFRY